MRGQEPIHSPIRVIDSHTEGEPTRVVVAGGPDLGPGTMAERLAVFRERFDWFRSAVVNEPRGSDAMVGALLAPPSDPRCAAGVIFFNNVGFLHMCVHGTIGLGVTLAHLGRIGPGSHRIETPVGEVTIHLGEDGAASVENVPCRRLLAGVTVDAPGVGRVQGDVAWGGNWFFLVEQDQHRQALELSRVDELTRVAQAIRRGVENAGLRGDDGRAIDHIELFGPPSRADRDSRNFVLCPGGAYDRSPCGTGTSAKLACLHAEGKLALGQPWRQESIIGSAFTGVLRAGPEAGPAGRGGGGGGCDLIPTISGGAWITGEATLILDPRDPFRHGIGAPNSAAHSGSAS